MDDETDATAGSTGTTWKYTYDLGGNIKTKTAYTYTTGTVGDAVESHIFTYGNAGWKDQLTKFDGTMITYDGIGNPLNDGTWNYAWQHGRQLRQMVRMDNSKSVVFEYNEEGLRTKKTVTNASNNVITTEYILHGKNIVHMTQGEDVLHFYYDAQDKPAIVIYDGTAYGYLYNLQGDVVALVDGTGTKVDDEMRLKRSVLYISVFILVLFIMILVIHHHMQKYPSPDVWYDHHKNELSKLLADSEYNIFNYSKESAAIRRISKTGSGMFEFAFYTLEPETAEFLLISNKPFDSSAISEYLESEFLIPDSMKINIPSELLHRGYYQYSGAGASSENREGFIRYTCLDDRCIYCKMYIPT